MPLPLDFTPACYRKKYPHAEVSFSVPVYVLTLITPKTTLTMSMKPSFCRSCPLPAAAAFRRHQHFHPGAAGTPGQCHRHVRHQNLRRQEGVGVVAMTKRPRRRALEISDPRGVAEVEQMLTPKGCSRYTGTISRWSRRNGRRCHQPEAVSRDFLSPHS